MNLIGFEFEVTNFSQSFGKYKPISLLQIDFGNLETCLLQLSNNFPVGTVSVYEVNKETLNSLLSNSSLKITALSLSKTPTKIGQSVTHEMNFNKTSGVDTEEILGESYVEVEFKDQFYWQERKDLVIATAKVCVRLISLDALNVSVDLKVLEIPNASVKCHLHDDDDENRNNFIVPIIKPNKIEKPEENDLTLYTDSDNDSIDEFINKFMKLTNYDSMDSQEWLNGLNNKKPNIEISTQTKCKGIMHEKKLKNMKLQNKKIMKNTKSDKNSKNKNEIEYLQGPIKWSKRDKIKHDMKISADFLGLNEKFPEVFRNSNKNSEVKVILKADEAKELGFMNKQKT